MNNACPLIILNIKFGKIATFDDYLKNGDEKSLGKLMDFLKKQQGNEKSHTITAPDASAIIDIKLRFLFNFCSAIVFPSSI